MKILKDNLLIILYTAFYVIKTKVIVSEILFMLEKK
jgi:hypothetical protein